MELTIYKKTVCGNCAQLMAILDRKGIKYNVINIDEDKQALEMVQKRGFMAAPVLLLNDGDQEIDSASGKAIMDIMKWDKAGYLETV